MEDEEAIWSWAEDLHLFTVWSTHKYCAFDLSDTCYSPSEAVASACPGAFVKCRVSQVPSQTSSSASLLSKFSSPRITGLETHWLSIVVHFLKAVTYLENATHDRRVYWITVVEYRPFWKEIKAIEAQGSRSHCTDSQEAERGECWGSILFSLLLNLETQLLEWIHSHLGWVCSLQLT